MSRRVVDAILDLSEYNRFSKGLFAWVGFPSTTFEYENAVREAGRSSWTFRGLLNYGLDGLLSFNNRPLRAALHLGMGLLLCAGLYTAWIVGAALVNGVQTPGYVTIITAVTGVAGVQMIMLGVIGEYTGRIYYEVKRRPHFLVKATNVKRTGVGPRATRRRISSPDIEADADLRRHRRRQHRHVLRCLPAAPPSFPVPCRPYSRDRDQHDRIVFPQCSIHVSDAPDPA